MSLLRGTALVMLLLLPAAAQAAAGQVLFALGRVEVQRGAQVLSATRGMPVEVGDTVRTGPTGLAQVRMQDGALLSLRYGSAMTVEDYRPAAPAPVAPAPAAGAPPQAAAATGGRAVLRLLRGAFRTVTGLIGRNAGDAYSVVTPVATIGIRGTDYSAAFCDSDCGTTPDGLYVGVSNGGVELSNDGGTLVLTNDQYGYVRDGTTAPGRTLEPPEVLDEPIPPEEEGEEGEGEGAETAAGDGAAPDGARDETAEARSLESSQPEGDYELRPGAPGRYAYASGTLGGSNDNGVYRDDRGLLNGFLDGQFVSIGTARNVNTGFDAGTGLRWGRWTGGIANAGGSSLDLGSASLHWIYGSTSSTTPALRITGSASYDLVGNTDPTDNLGNTGFLGDATLFADFTNQTVASTLNVGINNEVWVANGTGSITGGTPLFGGSYTVGINDALGAPIGSGTGSFDGFFTDNALGAGLGFSLLDGAGTEVSGAAAFAIRPGGP
jgi:hypothetical protein